VFFQIREVPGLKKKPSTAELLDWLKLLMVEDLPADALRTNEKHLVIPPLYGALLKNEQDVLPTSITEYLTLLGAMKAGVAEWSVDDFYYLSRATLVKDERHLDRFDRVFAQCFKGLEPPEGVLPRNLPEEWLRKLAEKLLSPEEMAKIEALGGFEALMQRLAELLAEQKERHQGGSKWIGTAGTSPFG